MSHATAEQLAAFTGQSAPDDAARLLQRATEVVDGALLAAVYGTNADGSPTDSAVAGVLADATCAQVEFWLASDEEDDVLGPVQGYSAGGVSIQTEPRVLAPRAARLLRLGGLIRAGVWS